MYHDYVSGVVSQQLTRDRVQQVVIVPLPLLTGTAVHVLYSAIFLLSSIGAFVVACFVTMGWISER